MIVNSTNMETGTNVIRGGFTTVKNGQYWHCCQLYFAINLIFHSYLAPYDVSKCDGYIWHFRQRPTMIIHWKQECIPVGCIPSASVTISGMGCLPRGCPPRGCSPREVSAWGCLPRGCLPGGCLPSRVCLGVCLGVCLPRGCTPPAHRMLGYKQPPVNRITDRCKNITFPQLHLRNVISKGVHLYSYCPMSRLSQGRTL